jgi:hypothetical protein
MDEFSQACGAAGPLLLEVEGGGPDGTSSRVVPGPCALIGRHPGADLVLRHEAVGQRHAYLQVVGGRLACIDLESRTGTRVGGRAGAQAWVRPGDPIEVGPYRVRARIDDGAGGPPAGGDGDDPGPLSGGYAKRHPEAGPPPVLEIRDARGDAVEYRLSRVLTLVGAARLCKVRLREAGASRFAGALLRTPGGVWAVDLLASEGLRHDGRPARHRRLDPGGALQVGPYDLRLVGDREPEGGAAARPTAGLPATLARAGPGGALRRAGPAGEAPEVVLVSVLDQVAQMQKQMSDQFQQAMLMMAQLFGSMHQEHMEAVREELAQIRRLTEQMEDLRRSTAPAPGGASRAPAIPAPPPPPGPPPATRPPPPPGRAEDVPADAVSAHVRFTERLAAFERERQGRWARVLRLLTGT